eukprot:m.68885 g.68885  ORF g.68885 m.68885 type:complete len:846 (+) comp16014_c0_seq1:358-2895(+)
MTSSTFPSHWTDESSNPSTPAMTFSVPAIPSIPRCFPGYTDANICKLASYGTNTAIRSTLCDYPDFLDICKVQCGVCIRAEITTTTPTTTTETSSRVDSSTATDIEAFYTPQQVGRCRDAEFCRNPRFCDQYDALSQACPVMCGTCPPDPCGEHFCRNNALCLPGMIVSVEGFKYDGSGSGSDTDVYDSGSDESAFFDSRSSDSSSGSDSYFDSSSESNTHRPSDVQSIIQCLVTSCANTTRNSFTFSQCANERCMTPNVHLLNPHDSYQCVCDEFHHGEFCETVRRTSTPSSVVASVSSAQPVTTLGVSTSVSPQEATFTDTRGQDSCFGRCEAIDTPGQCSCGENCSTSGNCCADYITECKGSCAQQCGGRGTSSLCACDENCTTRGECCLDYAEECQATASTTAMTTHTTSISVSTSPELRTRCAGSCGFERNVSTGQLGCNCDHFCETAGDCCEDYKLECFSSTAQTTVQTTSSIIRLDTTSTIPLLDSSTVSVTARSTSTFDRSTSISHVMTSIAPRVTVGTITVPQPTDSDPDKSSGDLNDGSDGSESHVLWILVAIIIVLVLLVIALFFRRRSRKGHFDISNETAATVQETPNAGFAFDSSPYDIEHTDLDSMTNLIQESDLDISASILECDENNKKQTSTLSIPVQTIVPDSDVQSPRHSVIDPEHANDTQDAHSDSIVDVEKSTILLHSTPLLQPSKMQSTPDVSSRTPQSAPQIYTDTAHTKLNSAIGAAIAEIRRGFAAWTAAGAGTDELPVQSPSDTKHKADLTSAATGSVVDVYDVAPLPGSLTFPISDTIVEITDLDADSFEGDDSNAAPELMCFDPVSGEMKTAVHTSIV